MTRFLEKPEEFASNGLVATQIGQNPFGDYGPQSTQIQGILRGMYDAFTADLEKANVEEAQQQKAFLAVMATKKAEFATLQTTLGKQTYDKATKEKSLAQSRVS